MVESHEQIAYIHWGKEYDSVHSKEQEVLAHFLIDNGVDAVIGHHPHVVQDIEVYKGKPIFYSLGNFIFDQYFSDEVQEGLAVRVDTSKDILRYTLIPFESKSIKSQPKLLSLLDKDTYLENTLSYNWDTKQTNSWTNPLVVLRGGI
jgi:poly-gamma-glutamate synthesis protein (capsule biosynthesis protein)